MKKKIVLLVLAAGASRRMGQAKQLMPIAGVPMLRSVLEQIAGLHLPTVVVLGARAADIAPVLGGLPVQLVEHPGWDAGMGSSLKAGLQALPQDADAVLCCVADQPYLKEAVLRRFIQTAEDQTTDDFLLAAQYSDGETGTPMLVPRSYFAALLRLPDDRGAKALLKQFPDKVSLVPFPEGHLDMDTPEDWQQLLDRQIQEN